MRLSDIMSQMDLTAWPIVGLVLFLSIFCGVLVYTFASGRSFERIAELPLEDDTEADAGRRATR